jgi:hypothetical protein
VFDSRKGKRFPSSPEVSDWLWGSRSFYQEGAGGGGVVKRPEAEGDHSPPSNAEAKFAWSHIPTPPYVFNGVVLNARDQLYLIHRTNIFPSTSRSLKLSRPFRFFDLNFVSISHLSPRAICPPPISYALI